MTYLASGEYSVRWLHKSYPCVHNCWYSFGGLSSKYYPELALIYNEFRLGWADQVRALSSTVDLNAKIARQMLYVAEVWIRAVTDNSDRPPHYNIPTQYFGNPLILSGIVLRAKVEDWADVLQSKGLGKSI